MRKRLFRNKKAKKELLLNDRYVQSLNTLADIKILDKAKDNISFIKSLLDNASDLVCKTIVIDQETNFQVGVVYIDELVNKDMVHNFIIRPIIKMGEGKYEPDKFWELVQTNIIEAGEISVSTEMKMAVDAVLHGDTVLFVDGHQEVLVMGTKGWNTKGISEPRSESVVRGPREGLTETIAINLGMIRRRIRDPQLRVKSHMIGSRTHTAVFMLYIADIADPYIVEEVEKRLQGIEIDGILESGYIEEFIQDQVWTPFPQIQNTERPDVVVGHLLEGKVAILVDGTPHVLIAPAVFTQFYYSPEDYYERFIVSSFLRLIRVASLFIALFLPALYIAFVTFHPEMIPTKLAIAMAAGRATVPFTPIVEALIMELSIEILREASIRIPGPMGPTIGIVGALVIGNAAVVAGLVSPAIVIVVGLTTISSYANPNYNAAVSVRLIRFPLMLASAALGLYGIMLATMMLLLHLVQLKSFGIPYMAPYSPLNLRDWRDSITRIPWNWMKKRPQIYRPHEKDRVGGDS